MLKVHVLTAGFSTPNGQAVLYPLILYEKELRVRGVELSYFYELSDQVFDCDVLIIEGRYYTKRWAPDKDGVLGEFEAFYQKINKVFMFDNVDSSGWDHAHYLPYVTALLKNQVLKDKSLYTKPLYGYRLHTDFAHQEKGIVDKANDYSVPIENKKLLNKIKISWNSGLANYSFWGLYRNELYRRFHLKLFLSFPTSFQKAGGERHLDVSCRYSTKYARETIAWQRKAVQEKMKNRVQTDRLSRRNYFKEMEHAKVILSPFGYGEINYRDYEVFLAGALLMKPDMSHMETWPNLYKENETYIAHKWDLSDFDEMIEDILANYDKYVEIAQAGQDNYRRYISGPDAADLFCQRFLDILEIEEEIT